MCKNIEIARFHCFRVHGDLNASRPDPIDDDGHYYHGPSGLKWAVDPVDDGGCGVAEVAPGAKPLCVQYAELLEQEKLNPPAPKTQRPAHIHRLKSRNRDNQIKLSARFEFDEMGNSYFEVGEAAKRMRELNELAATGECVIGGFKVKFIYNPRNYNETGAIETMRQIYDRGQKWWIEEDPYFNHVTCFNVVKALKDRAKWRDGYVNRTFPAYRSIDAWFDINYGLIWTIDNCNIEDLRLNLRKSVEEMDRKKAERAKVA